MFSHLWILSSICACAPTWWSGLKCSNTRGRWCSSCHAVYRRLGQPFSIHATDFPLLIQHTLGSNFYLNIALLLSHCFFFFFFLEEWLKLLPTEHTVVWKSKASWCLSLIILSAHGVKEWFFQSALQWEVA